MHATPDMKGQCSMGHNRSLFSQRRKHLLKRIYIALTIAAFVGLAVCAVLIFRQKLSLTTFASYRPNEIQPKHKLKPAVPSVPKLVDLPNGYSIPILCYHDFREVGKHLHWATPPKRFEAQLQMLNALGFTFLTMSEAVELIRGNWDKPIPKFPIVVTIDDGYRSAYTVAYPLLSKYGAKATLFVYTNAIGKFGLSWEQLREMIQSGKVEVASHTVSHTLLSKLRKKLRAKEYRARVAYEFTMSKRLLEEKLGVKVKGLAYTGGIVDATSIELAREAGYEWATIIKPEPLTQRTNIYRIPRYGISNGTTVMVLRNWLMKRVFAMVRDTQQVNPYISPR